MSQAEIVRTASPPTLTPTIRVVVVNWNRRELLRSCLESLAHQTHPSFEIIVVDNGSTDGSAEMVRTFMEYYPKPLDIIQNPDNRGFCAANNQGFAGARNEFIALLNNDAEAEPGWLEAMETAMRTSPEIGMVACKIRVWEEPQRIDKVGHLIYPDGQNRGRGSGAPGQPAATSARSCARRSSRSPSGSSRWLWWSKRRTTGNCRLSCRGSSRRSSGTPRRSSRCRSCSWRRTRRCRSAWWRRTSARCRSLTR